MKKHIFLFIIIITLLVACEDAIDINPTSQVSVDNYYKIAADIEQGVIAAYDALQLTGQYRQNYVYFMEVTSDNSYQASITNSGGAYGDFDLFRLVPSNNVLNETWRDAYRGIQRVNVVLNRIDNVVMDETLRNTRKGELKFLRALTYFNLVRIWGDMPLVLTETTDPFESFGKGRDNVDAVYAQIIKDLEEAVAALPVKQDIGRATKGAAQALLGKVYLTRKDFTKASTILREVVNAGTYKLATEFKDNFDVKKENGVESIFEVQFKSGGIGEGSPFANLFAPSGTAGRQLVGNIGGTLGDNLPTQDLLNAYAANDKRKDATIGALTDGTLYCKKYLDTPFQDRDANNNFIVLRYADVLLMAAEALNEQDYVAGGEAFTYLNQIRSRAGLTALTALELPDQQTFRRAIEKERQLELAFENHRWFDLVRTGRALEVMNAHKSIWGQTVMKSHQVLFPVPQTQIDASAGALKQNQGY